MLAIYDYASFIVLFLIIIYFNSSIGPLKYMDNLGYLLLHSMSSLLFFVIRILPINIYHIAYIL